MFNLWLISDIDVSKRQNDVLETSFSTKLSLKEMAAIREVKENPNISITPLATNAREFRESQGSRGLSGHKTRVMVQVLLKWTRPVGGDRRWVNYFMLGTGIRLE